MAKNYFAVVHKESGKFILHNSQLPIYWNKSVADDVAKRNKGYLVQPVDINYLERLILSKPNKKAK
jgi:hypothetical protein